MKTKFLLPILVIVASCGQEPSTTTTSTTTANQLAPSPVVPNGTYLAGIYATSEAEGHPIENLFDTSPQTTWKTKTGAGPDEGIMLYFNPEDSLDLATLIVNPLPNTFQVKDAKIQLYINGQPAAEGKPGDRLSLLDEKRKTSIQSIYIRFAQTGKEFQEQTALENSDLTQTKFPPNGFIGLQELTLLDSNGEPLPVLAPEKRPGTVVASSTLEPASAYDASKLFDARKEFAWVEGNPDTDGTGEWLRFSFDQEVNITGFRIRNGYQRSEQHRTANARAKNIRFGARNDASQDFQLADTGEAQEFKLGIPAKGKQFELHILSVYPGHSYRDLAISDLLFFDGKQAFSLASIRPQQQQKALVEKTNNSPLKSLLDRRVFNELADGDMELQQSLILRSDGTFVLYSESISDFEQNQNQILADGNWELLDSGPDAAQVKVFGKWYDFSKVSSYYQGTERSEITKIFKDVLTINKEGTIEGTRFIERFYSK
jgi:hypothetical protein